MNKKLNSVPSAGTKDEQRTEADFSTSASVEASPMLSAALSVEDANILIAKFMGFVVKDFGAAFIRYTFSDNEDAPYYDWFLCRDLEYNSSLDWLKPAIDAFINLDISVFNYNVVTMSEFRQVRQSLSNMPISKSIDDFFNELVTAIVWYNSAVSVGSR